MPPKRIFYYDNGPAHTIDFTPDTYVDVTSVWSTVREWLGKAIEGDRFLEDKEVLARYRGLSCARGFAGDATYAEAFKAADLFAQDIL